MKCRYRVKGKGTEDTEDTEDTCHLPEIGPAGNFESNHPRNALPENAVIIIEYESVAGFSYRTKLRIQDRRWVSDISFSPSST